MRLNKFHGGLVLAIAAAAAAEELSTNARDMFYSAADLVAVKKPAPPPRTRASRPKPNEPEPEPQPSRPLPELTDGRRRVSAVPETQYALATLNAVPLGLRYSILLKKGDGVTEVRPDRESHAGDSIRLSVMGNQPGYLYVVARGSSGIWTPLFPHPESAQMDNRIEAGRTYQIPGGPDEYFTFDQQTGEEHLFLLLARQPVRDLDDLMRGLTGTPQPLSSPPLTLEARSRLNDQFIDHLRGEVATRDLIFTKGNTSAGVKDDAVYVVNVNTSVTGSPRVVADVRLVHR
jgi:hypothetical protein